MPPVRSERPSSPLSGARRWPLVSRHENPMSLSRVLRGPSSSPFNGSKAVDSIFGDYFGPASSGIHTPGPLQKRTGDISPSKSPSHYNEKENSQNSPNPFLASPLTDPVTPRPSYPPPFNDACWTSPFVCSSPISKVTHPRALRRHGAVALLVPQTPSTNLPAARHAPREGDAEGVSTPSHSSTLTYHGTTVQHSGLQAIKTEHDSPQKHLSHNGANILKSNTPADSTIRAFKRGDVEFLSFDPNALPELETSLILKIDTKGISKAQFAELIAFCSICKTYMTRQSMFYHRHCTGQGLPIPPPEHESPTKALLRLVSTSSRGPAGGISEAHFCSLFSKCPHCFVFMTWDASFFHVCEADTWGASDCEADEAEPEESPF